MDLEILRAYLNTWTQKTIILMSWIAQLENIRYAYIAFEMGAVPNPMERKQDLPIGFLVGPLQRFLNIWKCNHNSS